MQDIKRTIMIIMLVLYVPPLISKISFAGIKDQMTRRKGYYPLFSAGENAKTISLPSDMVAGPCDQVTIPVEIDDAGGIAGMDLVLGFDPAVLIPVKVERTSLTEGFFLEVNDIEKGRLIIALASAVGITEGIGALVNLIFKVHPEGIEPDLTDLIIHSLYLHDKDAVEIEGITSINGKFTVQGEGSCCTVEKELTEKWNMVSMPVVLQEDALASDIFQDAEVIYSFKKGNGYVRVKANEEIEPKTGYWVLLPGARSYKSIGDCIQEYTLPVKNGWYMIGSCSKHAQASVNPGSIDVIYRYDPESGYQMVIETEKMEPGSGFWILLSGIPDQAELKVEGDINRLY